MTDILIKYSPTGEGVSLHPTPIQWMQLELSVGKKIMFLHELDLNAVSKREISMNAIHKFRSIFHLASDSRVPTGALD